MAALLTPEVLSVLLPVLAWLLSAFAQRNGIPFHPFGPAQPVPPASGGQAQPAPGQPSPQPAAQPAHPLADAVLSTVLGLVLKRRAGQTLSAAEHSELQFGLPQAQQLLAEAAVIGAANPPAPK